MSLNSDSHVHVAICGLPVKAECPGVLTWILKYYKAFLEPS